MSEKIMPDAVDEAVDAAGAVGAERDSAADEAIEAQDSQENMEAAQANPEEADDAETSAEAIARLEADVAAARQEAAANLEQMKRVAADFQNSKRRQEKQLAEAIDRAGAHYVQGALPILDDFDLAFQNAPADLSDEDAAWVDGFRQIQKKFTDLLTNQGVEKIPLDGEFDPNLHEAISSEPSDDVESGRIIETLRAGYTYKGRVLRPAMVRIAM
ncbi:MAG: nucleotide exchange factor GrpE [Caldilineaceae bacterium]|nr:nucleotide exchange factor GrpE [Caldilineaceae bacterium]